MNNDTYQSNEKKYNDYATEVLKHLNCNSNMRKRIREDVIESLNTRSEELGTTDPVSLMGKPKEVAADFAANIGLPAAIGWEYKSEANVLGIPLVHIVTNRMKIAKGIIAIGPVSVGVISLGAVSAGVFSFGAVALGLMALGGASIGFFLSVGGMAVAYDTALGGMSIARHLAVGGLAIAQDIAIGGQSIAQIAGHLQTPNIVNESIKHAYYLPEQAEQMMDQINRTFPALGHIKKTLIDFMLQR